MLAESRKLGTFGHGFTYAGHPVSSAVALETLKIYEERDIVGHVRSLAPHFQARLKALAGHPLVGEARGVGPGRRGRAGARQGDARRRSTPPRPSARRCRPRCSKKA